MRGLAATLRSACRRTSNADSGSRGADPIDMAGGGVCGGGGPGMSVGQPVPVRLVDHPGAAAGGAGMGGEPAAAVDAQGVDADPVTVWVGMNLQLDSLPGPDQPGGNRVAAGLETRSSSPSRPAAGASRRPDTAGPAGRGARPDQPEPGRR